MKSTEAASSRAELRRATRLLWRLIVGLAFGLGLLVFVARGVDLEAVWTGFLGADSFFVGLAFLTVLATMATKVGRWYALFPRGEHPSLPALTRALLVGQLANALLPARVGEVARAYLIGYEGEGSSAITLGTVAAEKAFDVFFLLLSSGLVAFTLSLPSWMTLSLGGLAAVGTAVLLAAVALPRQRIVVWADRWAGRVGWVGIDRLLGILQRGLVGLEVLRTPRQALIACVWSAVVWTLAASTNGLLFLAFHLHLSWTAALWLLVLLHVGVAPPSSPGRLGVFHALTVWGLATFGVDRSIGLAYAAVLHALVYLPQVTLGGVALVCSQGRLRWHILS